MHEVMVEIQALQVTLYFRFKNRELAKRCAAAILNHGVRVAVCKVPPPPEEGRINGKPQEDA